MASRHPNDVFCVHEFWCVGLTCDIFVTLFFSFFLLLLPHLVNKDLCIIHTLHTEQESCATAKMTARCAFYMSDWSFGWVCEP